MESRRLRRRLCAGAHLDDESFSIGAFWRRRTSKPHGASIGSTATTQISSQSAQHLCLIPERPRILEQGRVVICSDEKTGMQILQRKYPTQPMYRAKPEKREHEYIRHGVRALIASFVVATGQVVGIWARRAPAPILPCIWPMWSTNCQRCSATTGCG